MHLDIFAHVFFVIVKLGGVGGQIIFAKRKKNDAELKPNINQNSGKKILKKKQKYQFLFINLLKQAILKDSIPLQGRKVSIISN